jgi:hypothetical protein
VWRSFPQRISERKLKKSSWLLLIIICHKKSKKDSVDHILSLSPDMLEERGNLTQLKIQPNKLSGCYIDSFAWQILCLTCHFFYMNLGTWALNEYIR